MKIKQLLLTGAVIGTAFSTQAQWQIDSLSVESSYLNNVYYSLENGVAKESAADNWHLAFSLATFDASILTNSAANGCKLYVLSEDSTVFGTDLSAALSTAITLDPVSLYNSNHTWEVGAFNQSVGSSQGDYGWGEYNMTTHLLTGKTVFALITANDTFQIFIQSKNGLSSVPNSPVYDFKFAQLDGSNIVNKTLEAGVATYADQNFAYYNIDTDQFLSREPAKTDWDFVFTKYNDESVQFNNEWYSVFGILTNNGTSVAMHSVDSFPEHDDLNHEALTLTYNDTINAFGYDKWKYAGMNGAGAYDTVSFFVKVQTGDIWQLVYTDFVSGSAAVNPGLIVLQKRLVYEAPDTSTGINTINADITTLTVAPNPSYNGTTNILIDAKKQINNVAVQIIDINGRVVGNKSMTIRQGFNQYPVDIASLNTGMYFIRLHGEDIQQTIKFIKE